MDHVTRFRDQEVQLLLRMSPSYGSAWNSRAACWRWLFQTWTFRSSLVHSMLLMYSPDGTNTMHCGRGSALPNYGVVAQARATCLIWVSIAPSWFSLWARVERYSWNYPRVACYAESRVHVTKCRVRWVGVILLRWCESVVRDRQSLLQSATATTTQAQRCTQPWKYARLVTVSRHRRRGTFLQQNA